MEKKKDKDFDVDEALALLLLNVEGFEDKALMRMGKRIKDVSRLSAYDMKSLENIVYIGVELDEIYKELAAATDATIKDMQTLIENNIAAEMKKDSVLYKAMNEECVPFEKNELAKEMVKNWAERTGGELINLSRTKAIGFTDRTGKFTPIEGAYQTALDKAVVAVRTGTDDFNSAMRDTIEALGGSGVVTNYGSGVTRSVESAVRANILYGVKQSAQQYHDAIGEKFEADGFEVDYHPHPRPSHEFMGGVMYSNHGDVTIDGVTYKDGSEALERLQDYNCLHFATPVILGISEPTYDKKWLEEQKKKDKEVLTYDTPAGRTLQGTRYYFTQKQRELERAVRKQRRIQEMAQAAGNTDLARDAQAKIDTLREYYNDMCEKTGLQRTDERMA